MAVIPANIGFHGLFFVAVTIIPLARPTLFLLSLSLKQKGTLVMKNLNRRKFLQVSGASVVSLYSGTNLHARQNPPGPVNLLFIMTDQQRFDALSCGGNKILQTPNLDRLAKEGAFFENAYTNCPICVPARAVILTGHTIESVRVRGNLDHDNPDVPDIPTFDNILSAKGYCTEYYGKWHTPYKFARTYDNDVRQTGKHSQSTGILSSRDAYIKYLDDKAPARKPRDGELIDNSSLRPYKPDPLDWRYGMTQAQSDSKRKSEKQTRPGQMNIFSQAGSYGCLDIGAQHSRTAYTAKLTIAALERLKDKPFSLTCSIGPPHPPMILPRPYYDMYKPEDIPVPPSIDDPMDNSPYAQRAGSEEMQHYRNKDHVRRMTSNYYGMVKEIDDWVGKILDKLKELGLDKNTLVIFTSDHGEMLGDHGLHSKMVLYEGAAHIPLIMRLPAEIPAGSAVTTPVAHVDLFATILDYLKMQPNKSDGRSLRNLIEGKADTGPDFCVSEWGASRGPTIMVRTKEYKYICSHSSRFPSIDALYNLKDDPHEMNNLIGNNPDKAKYKIQVEQIRARLISWLEKTNSPRLKGVKQQS